MSKHKSRVGQTKLFRVDAIERVRAKAGGAVIEVHAQRNSGKGRIDVRDAQSLDELQVEDEQFQDDCKERVREK